MRQAYAAVVVAPTARGCSSRPTCPGRASSIGCRSRGGELEQLTSFAEPVDGQLLPDGRLLLEIDEGGNERTQLYVLDGERARAARRRSALHPPVAARLARRHAARVRDEPPQRPRLRHRRPRDLEHGRGAESSSSAAAAASGVDLAGRPLDRRRAGSASGAATRTSSCSTSRAARSSHVTPHEGEAEYLDAGLARRRRLASTRDERGPRHVRDLAAYGVVVVRVGVGSRLSTSTTRAAACFVQRTRTATRGSTLHDRTLLADRRGAAAGGTGSSSTPSSRRTARCSRSGSRRRRSRIDVYVYDVDSGEALTAHATSGASTRRRRAGAAPLRELRRRVDSRLPLPARGRRAVPRRRHRARRPGERSGCRGSRRASRR